MRFGPSLPRLPLVLGQSPTSHRTGQITSLPASAHTGPSLQPLLLSGTPQAQWDCPLPLAPQGCGTFGGST